MRDVMFGSLEVLAQVFLKRHQSSLRWLGQFNTDTKAYKRRRDKFQDTGTWEGRINQEWKLRIRNTTEFDQMVGNERISLPDLVMKNELSDWLGLVSIQDNIRMLMQSVVVLEKQ